MLNQLAQQNERHYNLIIGDAFNDLTIPYHLSTREFDESLRRLLKDDGLYLALVVDKPRGGKFMPAFTATLRSVWPAVQVLSDAERWESDSAGNYVVSAANQGLDSARLAGVRGQGALDRPVTHIMPGELMRRWLEEANAPLLTDDYAPVDNLIAPVFAERGF